MHHKIYPLLIFFIMPMARAWTTQACAERIRGQWNDPMEMKFNELAPKIHEILKLEHELSAVEYEVIQDSASGLTLKALFDDGVVVALDGEYSSTLRLHQHLPRHRILSFQYDSRSGELLEALDTLAGEAIHRGLTRHEKQALKWAYFHTRQNAGNLNQYLRDGRDLKWITEMQALTKKLALTTSLAILGETFSRGEAAVIYDQVVKKDLVKFYDQLLAQFLRRMSLN